MITFLGLDYFFSSPVSNQMLRLLSLRPNFHWFSIFSIVKLKQSNNDNVFTFYSV